MTSPEVQCCTVLYRSTFLGHLLTDEVSQVWKIVYIIVTKKETASVAGQMFAANLFHITEHFSEVSPKYFKSDSAEIPKQFVEILYRVWT